MPRLRDATPEDAGFMARLYAATRAAELAATGWPEASCLAFLGQQHALREAAYCQAYPGSPPMLLLAGDPEEPVGRCWLASGPDGALHLVDLALLPDWQGRGLGSWCLRQAQQRARATGQPLRLQVLQGNPAQALYARHGFLPGPVQGLHQHMQWQAASPARSPSLQESP